MEENGKLHSTVSLIIAWVLSVIYWVGTHLGIIIGILAGAASIYSIIATRAAKRASDETTKLRRMQQEQLTSSHKQEPDTDI